MCLRKNEDAGKGCKQSLKVLKRKIEVFVTNFSVPVTSEDCRETSVFGHAYVGFLV